MSVNFLLPTTNTDYYFDNEILASRYVNSGWGTGQFDEVKGSRKTTGTEVTGDGIGNGKTYYGFLWRCVGY